MVKVVVREKRRKQKPDREPEPEAERATTGTAEVERDEAAPAAAESPTIVRRKVSRVPVAGPTGTEATTSASGGEAAVPPTDARATAGDEAPAEGSDQFDALGTQIAAVLRQAQETSERVRTEAAEQALATASQAEADARRIVEAAETEAREKLAQAEAQIEQQWTAAAQQLEEATQALEVAREQDRALRQDAADHLANALAARDAGTEILEGATRQLERAEVAARDLEAHAEAARQEAAQIAADLHALAEHFGQGSGVIDLRADAVPPGPADDAAETTAAKRDPSAPPSGAA